MSTLCAAVDKLKLLVEAFDRTHRESGSPRLGEDVFRVLGAGLLVHNLSPGMPKEFAVSTAAGDSLTALLAALAFIGLRQGWPSARGLAWACSIVGSLDLLVAFPHAATTGAISHMAAQWYVPVFAGPPLVICHVACFVLLIRGGRSG